MAGVPAAVPPSGQNAARAAAGPHDLAALLTPSQPAPAGQLLADRLLTAIALGEFTPGQRLPAERELSALLGVSRTTVRDALARVAEAGLVEIRRGRAGGAFVLAPWSPRSAQAVRDTLAPQWAQLQHTFDFRRLVEGLVARTAAERRNDDDMASIGAALAGYQEALDLAQAQAADLRLHHAVAAAARNPRLLALRQQLLSEVSFGFAVEPFTPAVYERALPQHVALAEAVISGRPDAAWRLGSEHFAITEHELRALRDRVGPGDDGA